MAAMNSSVLEIEKFFLFLPWVIFGVCAYLNDKQPCRCCCYNLAWRWKTDCALIYWARLVIPVSSFAAILTELCTLKPEVCRHFIKLAINVSSISPSFFNIASTLARNSSASGLTGNGWDYYFLGYASFNQALHIDRKGRAAYWLFFLTVSKVLVSNAESPCGK